MSPTRVDSSSGIGVGILIIVAVVLGLWGCTAYNTQHTRVITVCDKERAATDSGAEYRIYTDSGTFVMKDSLLGKVRYDTADAYGRVKEGTTYKATYKGWRFGPTSNFPNILALEKLPEDQQTPELCE